MKRRQTKQRTLILEELRELRTHPTADELFSIIRSKMPKISLGTVYRNLEILETEGYIHKLDDGDGPRRYDGVLEDHYHIRCIECGRIEDIAVNGICFDSSLISSKPGWSQINGSITISGICPKCSLILRALES